MPADQQYQDHQEHYSVEAIHGIDEISVPAQAASNNWVANAFTGWLGVSIIPSDEFPMNRQIDPSLQPNQWHYWHSTHVILHAMTDHDKEYSSLMFWSALYFRLIAPGSPWFSSFPTTQTNRGSPSVRLGVFQATWFGGATDSRRLLWTWPIPSRYGIFTNIWLICMVNVGK